jgi:hypothetical protein
MELQALMSIGLPFQRKFDMHEFLCGLGFTQENADRIIYAESIREEDPQEYESIRETILAEQRLINDKIAEKLKEYEVTSETKISSDKDKKENLEEDAGTLNHNCEPKQSIRGEN